jgi:uncharacterized Zn finger protein
MARSTCVKCGNHFFEVIETEPNDSQYKMYFVQCSKCGGVVGATDYYNVPIMLIKLGKKLGVDLLV